MKVKDDTTKQEEINWSFETTTSENKTEVTPELKEEKEVIRHYLTDDVEEKTELENARVKPILSPAEQQQKAKERMERIQEYTHKLKDANGLTELEKEPAYKRRDIKFDDIEHSSEDVKESRFTLGAIDENGQTKIELRDNNSFLHDNVD